MAEPGWPRHAVLMGVFGFRRSARTVRRDTARLALMALALLFPSVVLGGFLLLFAGSIGEAGPVALPSQIRGTIALLWFFGVFMSAQRVASARPRVDAEALVLTTVSSRTAAVGGLLAETLRAFAYVGVPTVVVTAGFVYAFGSLLSLVTVPLAVATLTTTAVVVGAVFGYAVAWFVATSPFVARHKTLLGGLVVVAAMGGYALTFLPGADIPAQETLSVVPIGWLADLAVLGTPIRGSPIRAATALVSAVLVLLMGGAIVARETAALWFVDPVSPDDGEDRGVVDWITSDRAVGARRSARDPLSAAIRPIRFPAGVPRPTRRVAEWALLRTRRDPRRLTFLLMPVVFVGSMLVSAGAGSGAVRSLLPPMLAVALPWLASGLVGLNPLGVEGAVLPITLTSTSGRSYVRGLLLPGLLYGLPVVVVATAAAGAFSPYSVTQVAALSVVGGFLTVVGTVLAPAIGMRLPRFSAIRVGQSGEVLPPRIVAVGLHVLLVAVPGSSLVLLVVSPTAARSVVAVLVGHLPGALLGLVAGGSGGPLGLAAGWFSDLGGAIRATSLGSIQLVAGLVLLAGGVAVAAAAYRSAVRCFDRYEPT